MPAHYVSNFTAASRGFPCDSTAFLLYVCSCSFRCGITLFLESLFRISSPDSFRLPDNSRTNQFAVSQFVSGQPVDWTLRDCPARRHCGWSVKIKPPNFTISSVIGTLLDPETGLQALRTGTAVPDGLMFTRDVFFATLSPRSVDRLPWKFATWSEFGCIVAKCSTIMANEDKYN